jgi:hypothetical protein
VAFDSRGWDFDHEERLVPRTYTLPELPWEQIAGRLERYCQVGEGSGSVAGFRP